MENFFGHLKSEMFHGEHFADFEELRAAIEAYSIGTTSVGVKND